MNTALSILTKAIDNQRLPHAILLYGPQIEDLEKTALALAQKVLNTQQSAHPDLFTLRPTNKMRQINAESMRALIQDIQKTPQQGIHKIGIIYEADRLHPTAANSFLKTLEEPPPFTTLLLLSTRLYELLPTIRSRCFQFFVPNTIAHTQESHWAEWAQSYQSWLYTITSEKNISKKAICDWTLSAYALIYKFENLLETITKAHIDTWKENAPDTVSSEEKIALESAISKSIRQKFFITVEEITHTFFKKQYSTHPHPEKLASQLIQAIHCLESLVKLLPLNINECVLLESFFLQSLKIWTQ